MRTDTPSLGSRLFMALVFVFLYAPILVLIVFSFNDSSSRVGMGRLYPGLVSGAASGMT